MNVNIKNLNLSVIMPAITKSGQLVCNDRVPSKEDKVEHASGLYLIYKDGHAEPFTGDNPKDCVRYIGLKHKDVCRLLRADGKVLRIENRRRGYNHTPFGKCHPVLSGR